MKALTPIEQRTVVFYDDELTAVVVDVDGSRVIYVPVRPVCDFLGVDWRSQYRRIQRDPVLSKHFTGVVITTTPDPVTGGGGPQATNCLPLDYLTGFLFGINANRVKKEIRDRLIRYQEECYRVLADAFLTQSPETAVSTTQANLIQIREMGRAITRMADEQLQMDRRLNKAAIIVGQHNKRITAIERQLSPRNAITTAQAADISEKVKAVAMALTEANPDKNYFQAIFAELHRRYRVSSYKDIRQDQYQPVLDFLDEWMEKMS